MSSTQYVQPMAPRAWGFTPEQLAEQPTVYAPGLLAGRTLLVSGGGSGMGRATAFLAARLGANVIICGRDADKLQRASTDAQRLLGKSFECHAMTIRDAERVDRLMDELFERHGQIDALVNSAGGQFPQNAIDFSVKGWLAVVDTNLNGTWYMMQAAARRWRDRKQAGSVVNIIANYKRGIPQSAHTAAARAGVAYLSKSVAVEWAPLDIRVNCIAPGTIETEGLNQYPPETIERGGKGNPLRRRGDVWDIAEAVIYLCAASGKFITGEVLQVDGGMQCWGTNWPLGVPEQFRVDG
ncbi:MULTISPECIES: SDR family oxidoreductase [Hydrocarboniphaga]|jgi:citronellol/citronellal dehydrogenase|uniref:Peroxisomal trans-2-enoyl-CoA reductase n=1 Tax=Hydrocarboniphaga effusa AP103 TaxID=1172194 RepID=I8TAL1_9GAMM|nr:MULTISPECIES: SDR family oxidoreductase [Hydrocarboniphaga]EIT70760.1 Short-chain dehydrogenase/reductase SDR [Hydrocarboniphaga effusa AP103]MDZ4079865.1 SDR family oxidoreductase [Hydrocarboniphaga sp.]